MTLPIADGAMAGQEFSRVTFGDVSETERARVRTQLLRYCGQDTGGMIDICKQVWMTVARARDAASRPATGTAFVVSLLAVVRLR